MNDIYTGVLENIYVLDQEDNFDEYKDNIF